MKQSLLTDIELDVQELKYLVDALSKEHSQALCEIAKRNILQMRSRLDNLYEELSTPSESAPVKEPQEQVREEEIKEPVLQKCNVTETSRETVHAESLVVKPSISEVVSSVEIPLLVSDILKTDLRHSISLNDSFRFTRELFGGDGEKMNKVVKAIDAMTSYVEAVSYVESEITLEDSNDAALDFMELLKKRFM